MLYLSMILKLNICACEISILLKHTHTIAHTKTHTHTHTHTQVCRLTFAETRHMAYLLSFTLNNLDLIFIMSCLFKDITTKDFQAMNCFILKISQRLVLTHSSFQAFFKKSPSLIYQQSISSMCQESKTYEPQAQSSPRPADYEAG